MLKTTILVLKQRFTAFKNCIYRNSELGKSFRKLQFFSLKISGAEMVEYFRCTGRSEPVLGPGLWGFSLTSLVDDAALQM